MEFYDLFIAVLSATVVWPTLFFSGLPASEAFAISIMSFVITYITRPIGAFIFGHFGDKNGRKNTMIYTIIIVSVSMLLIGLVPGYLVKGIFAAAFITVIRAVEGLGLGGDYGGAASMISESVQNSKWRYFWMSFANSSATTGISISTITFGFIASLMPHSSFLAYGWRYPFLIGGLIGLLGFFMRRRLSETTVFKKALEEGHIDKNPAVEAFRKEWKKIIFFSLAFLTINSAVLIQTPFALLLFEHTGLSTSTASYIIGITAIPSNIVLILLALLNSRIFRKKLTSLIGIGMAAIMVWPAFHLMQSGSPYIDFGGLLLVGAFGGVPLAVMAGLLTENIGVKHRYTVVGLSLQITTAITASVAGVFIPLFLAKYHGPVGASPYVAVVWDIICIVAFVSMAFYMKETRGLPEDSVEESKEPESVVS